MSCSNIDWKGYALGELDSNARAQAEAHAATCDSCREELAATRLTLDALSTLREEEVPRRIAFVSDKVFEPRWYETIWRSVPVMGLVSAALLAAAIFALPGTPAIQIGLDVGFSERKPRRTTVNHAANRRPVALAKGRDPKQMSERIERHGERRSPQVPLGQMRRGRPALLIFVSLMFATAAGILCIFRCCEKEPINQAECLRLLPRIHFAFISLNND